MPTPAPSHADPADLGTQFLLMRQAQDNSHATLLEGQRRIETSVGALREDVARTYVDKVTHTALEGRVKGCEDKIVTVDGKVGVLSGYMGWLVKTIIGIIATAGAAFIFSKGGMHP